MRTIFRAYDLWDVVGSVDTSAPISNESSSGEASGSKDKKTEPGEAAAETKEKRIKDAKALSIIQGALTDDIFPRIRNEETARGAWDLLRREFRGDDKVREVKLQAARAEFEYMRMAEGESLDHYLTKFFGVINDMKSLGEEITEQRIVQKTLMSLNLKTLRSEEVIASIKVFDRREDMYDERERFVNTEKAFSSLRIGEITTLTTTRAHLADHIQSGRINKGSLQIGVKVEVCQICKMQTGIRSLE
ncbi:TMV resistance protein [Salix suchowensis]|nr:TMV resistance protein [Salix suchowensis]